MAATQSIRNDTDFGWYYLDDTKHISYTSMLGSPIVSLPRIGNFSLKAETFYWSIECGAWTQEDFRALADTQTTSFNLTLNTDAVAPERIGFQYKTRHILNQAPEEVAGTISTSTCYATPKVVESDIGCQDRSCKGPATFLDLILRWMPGTGLANNGLSRADSSELVEHWIANPDLSQFDEVLRPEYFEWNLTTRQTNLARLGLAEFGHRLQIAMNTYWDASVGSVIRTGNFTVDQVDMVGTDMNYKWNSTELNGVRLDGEQYVCNVAFSSITMAISFALFLAALVSLSVTIKAPDILGYVSTSARDSPYVKKHIRSHSDGLHSARQLRDVRMRIGDVNEQGDVGHVAFTTIEQGQGKLSRKRLYD